MVNIQDLKLFTLIAVCTLQMACSTHLKSFKIDPEESKKYNAYLDGIQYSLPKTQFSLKTTYRIISCGSTGEIGAQLELSTTSVPDPNNHYVIDKDALSSWTKSTSIKVDYHPNMMIKSINATADDKIGPIVVEVISTVAKIATVLGAAAGSRSEPCTPAALIAVDAVKVAETNIKLATQKLELFEPQLTHLRALKAEKGDKWTAADRVKYIELIDEFRDVSILLIQSKADLQENLKKISFERKSIWSPNSDEFMLAQLGGAFPIFDGLNQNDADVKAAFSVDTNDLRDKTFIKNTEIYVKMDNASTLKGVTTKDTAQLSSPYIKSGEICLLDNCKFHTLNKSDFKNVEKDEKSKKNIGLVYRYPSVVTLKFCSFKSCPAEKEALTTYTGPVAQLGKLQAISLKSPPFTNRKFSATFAEDGTPTMLEFSTDSSGQNIATTLKSAVTSSSEIYTAEQGKELKGIQNETSLLKAKKDLIDLKSSMVDKPKTADEQAIANFNEETLLINAEVQNIKAKNELEKLLAEGI